MYVPMFVFFFVILGILAAEYPVEIACFVFLLVASRLLTRR